MGTILSASPPDKDVGSFAKKELSYNIENTIDQVNQASAEIQYQAVQSVPEYESAVTVNEVGAEETRPPSLNRLDYINVDETDNYLRPEKTDRLYLLNCSVRQCRVLR